jgi:alkaline phosphatase
MNRTIFRLSAVVLVLVIFASCQVRPKKEQEVKNIILMIGDGMGLAQVHAAYLANNNTLTMTEFRHIGLQKTSSANRFTTCSAAASTALASGVKTNRRYIGLDPEGNPVKTILDYAEEKGLATGLVATASITHATPAGFIANQIDRYMYEEIALDFLSSDIDVFIGGGRNHFNKRKDGRDLLVELTQKGYKVVFTMDEVLQVNSGKLAGLIDTLRPPRYSEGRGDMLPNATVAAINLLSQNEKGFFLMIEGAQIDNGGHDKDADYIIQETLDFDRAVAKAYEFAKKDGKTLLIVTADHETSGMALLDSQIDLRQPDYRFIHSEHTGIMVPVFAYGPGAEKFMGVYENTDIFHKMMSLFGFSAN